jgi:hypothetical protein
MRVRLDGNFALEGITRETLQISPGQEGKQ